jgi:hypothetical protein
LALTKDGIDLNPHIQRKEVFDKGYVMHKNDTDGIYNVINIL